ncbi:MAG: hypothetical protein ABH823_05925 [bacterium]
MAGIFLIAIILCGCGKYESKIPTARNNIATTGQFFYGSTVVGNNYHIYLSNRPLVSSESVVITVDGRELAPEVDFILPQRIPDSPSGYYLTSPEADLAYVTDRADPSDGCQTASMKILRPDLITAESQVFVVYTYYKSIVAAYQLTGQGITGPYYLAGTTNIVPGSEIIQVWEQGTSVVTTYTRNSSFESDAGDEGYAFNYNKENPSVTFNSPLAANNNAQVIFQVYVEEE